MAAKAALAASLSLAALLATSAVALAGPEKLVTQNNASYGSYLSNDDGHAVYLFTADSKGKSACQGACAQAWPPMMTSGAPLAGAGVDASLLGAIPRDGGTQVTYAGRPLYYFAGDKRAGSTAGQGINHFGGAWYLVAPNGKEIEKEVAKKSGSR
jgi:predicted lipoprotein with Yx(FWY)xxD motif